MAETCPECGSGGAHSVFCARGMRPPDPAMPMDTYCPDCEFPHEGQCEPAASPPEYFRLMVSDERDLPPEPEAPEAAALRRDLAAARTELAEAVSERDQLRAIVDTTCPVGAFDLVTSLRTELDNWKMWEVEQRAELERVTRERDEARADRDAAAKWATYWAEERDRLARERDDARAELAAERARRERTERVAREEDITWREVFDRAEWAESVAERAMAEGHAECQRLRAEIERRGAENLRWRDQVYAQLCAVMGEAARWKTWARLAVAAYVEAEGDAAHWRIAYEGKSAHSDRWRERAERLREEADRAEKIRAEARRWKAWAHDLLVQLEYCRRSPAAKARREARDATARAEAAERALAECREVLTNSMATLSGWHGEQARRADAAEARLRRLANVLRAGVRLVTDTPVRYWDDAVKATAWLEQSEAALREAGGDERTER